MNDLMARAREALLRGEWDWEGDDFTVAYLNNTVTVDVDATEFADEVTAAVIGTAALDGRAVLTGGVADADDVTTIVVPIGQTVTAVIIYKDTGDLATSPIIAYYDQAEDYTPIGRAGAGAAIPCLWSNSADRVFAI